jgi:pyruvate dehydrogenase E1 component alpha subunit
MSDPAKYRTKEEVEEYKEKDPLTIVLKTLQDNKWINDAELEAINERVKTKVEDSVNFAEESPWPSDDELYKDVYIQQDYPFIVD